MSKNDKRDSAIKCNVVDCAHNCVKDCTCRLDTIQVCTCNGKRHAESEDGTACNSYKYVGDLNEKETAGL